MSSFQSDTPPSSDYITQETTTFLLARDEDCENSFHSTADFVTILIIS